MSRPARSADICEPAPTPIEARPLRILRPPEVEHKVGLKKTQIYELISQNEFPRGIKLSKQATGWLEHEVDAFLLARIAASRENPCAGYS